MLDMVLDTVVVVSIDVGMSFGCGEQSEVVVLL